MNPDPTSAAAAGPLEAAVDQVRVGVQHLIKLVDDGALHDLGAVGLVGFLQDWEQVRNLMPVVDGVAIEHGTEQDVPRTLTQRSMAQVLAQGLRLSMPEARQRVRTADHLAARRSMLGEPLPPIRPHLAAAQREGAVTPEQVAVIDTALRKVDRCDPAEVSGGEQILVTAAADLGPADLRLLADKVVNAIDPDGSLPAESEQQRRRHLNLRQRRDGAWVGEFRLTPALGRKLKDLLDPLTRPATTSHDTDRASGSGSARKFVEDDDRTLGQRRHDALESVLDRLLRRDDNPDAGGTPATLIITMTYADFTTRRGDAHLSDGSHVSVGTALSLAEQTDIAFCLTDNRGAVLDLHRTKRIASKDQTLALYARDGGCSFTTCTVPPEWCERHRVVAWWHGGSTNLTNLTLLCPFHHHQFERRGWQCQMRDGLPYWIPPEVDRPRTEADREPPHHRHPLASPRPARPVDRTSRITTKIPDPDQDHRARPSTTHPEQDHRPTAAELHCGGYRHADLGEASNS